MSKNIINFFHACIIASFLLSLSGCGYKGDPVYQNQEQQQTAK
ncbi:MAG: lipoprotein [Candidatus Marinarcus sp.]